MEGDDVGVPERLEDVDLAVEVFLEFLVELREVDRLDGYGGVGRLFGVVLSANSPISVLSHSLVIANAGSRPKGKGERKPDGGCTSASSSYLVPAHVDLGKAALSNLGPDDELPDGFVARASPPSTGGRRRGACVGHFSLWCLRGQKDGVAMGSPRA